MYKNKVKAKQHQAKQKQSKAKQSKAKQRSLNLINKTVLLIKKQKQKQ